MDGLIGFVENNRMRQIARELPVFHPHDTETDAHKPNERTYGVSIGLTAAVVDFPRGTSRTRRLPFENESKHVSEEVNNDRIVQLVA